MSACVLRLNGLGPAVFFMYANVRPYAWVTMSSLLISPFDIPSNRRVMTLVSSSTVVMSNSMALQRDTVITGDPHRPQVILLDLAAAPSRLGLSGPGGQLTLSNLVLGNAAPLLSSLVCGAAARQQGVACHPTSLDNMTDPTASSRAVWRATGLADLGDEAPLPPLCSPALAEALGGLTSLLWFFSIPRAPDLDNLPPIASAPLVLLNVTILLPDLEAQAIREVAVDGSTRVNLRPHTLDLLRSQLAGQQVLPAAWPPGGFTFPTFSWFGIRGLHVTLAPATPTDPWGTPWADLWNDPLPQLVPNNSTTM
ncbi:protein kinase domain-containing protein, partial [Haematococcus lacustris]